MKKKVAKPLKYKIKKLITTTENRKTMEYYKMTRKNLTRKSQITNESHISRKKS